ncbi:signal peptidase complex-like protein DTM1 [Silene latifolia]|uniref:signal peptidase complex-like protein DTM1 n=1 Tax=Silene latifolia TaxID=37657 RepID=UPI003D774DA2
MGNDEALTRSLLCLAMVIIIVGISTHSFKKMLVTYFVGLLGISGVLLPDWDFFDRDVSQWTRPVTVDSISPADVLRRGSTRFRFYPVRTIIYAVVYSFGLYKWWKYVTH